MEKAEDAFGAAGTNVPLHRVPWWGVTILLGTKKEMQGDERGSKQPWQLHALHRTTPLLLWVRRLHFDQRERNQ